MSLYKDYLEETGIKNAVEKEWGFATYAIRGQECYLDDLYIVPDQRKSGGATKLGQEIEEIAKVNGCKYLTTSINTAIKDPTTSMKAILSFGFTFLRSEPAILWFVKPL